MLVTGGCPTEGHLQGITSARCGCFLWISFECVGEVAVRTKVRTRWEDRATQKKQQRVLKAEYLKTDPCDVSVFDNPVNKV